MRAAAAADVADCVAELGATDCHAQLWQSVAAAAASAVVALLLAAADCGCPLSPLLSALGRICTATDPSGSRPASALLAPHCAALAALMERTVHAADGPPAAWLLCRAALHADGGRGGRAAGALPPLLAATSGLPQHGQSAAAVRENALHGKTPCTLTGARGAAARETWNATLFTAWWPEYSFD